MRPHQRFVRPVGKAGWRELAASRIGSRQYPVLVPVPICGEGYPVLDFTFNPVALMGGFLFSLIGMVAFYYGKKNAYWQPMVMGLALMFYPYFIYEAWMVYTIGVALTVGLFVFRGED